MFMVIKMRKIKRKYYNVYFMNEYMESFDTKQEAKRFIIECLKFDKDNKNPYGVKKENYTIEVEENE